MARQLVLLLASLGVVYGGIFLDQKEYGASSQSETNAQFDDDTMTVVNDQLTSKTATGDQPEIQEQLDYAPRMPISPYQLYNPMYRPYVARMPLPPVYPHPYVSPYFGVSPDDIRFLHYMNANPLVYNRGFFAFV